MSKKKIKVVDGETYAPKSSQKPVVTEGLPYMIVRTYSAGVFAGWVKKRNGTEAILVNARRIWKWSGAAELGELATRGTSRPQDCKFPAPVPEVHLTQVIELTPITDKAKATIDEVPIWTT
jgi:hypothetical protein